MIGKAPVQIAADLAITASVPQLTAQGLLYEMTVTNNGPSNASSTILTDVLPGSVVFVTASTVPSLISCKYSTDKNGNHIVSCSIGNLGIAESVVISILVKPTVQGSVTNTASVSSSVYDPDNTNNTSSTTYEVEWTSDLGITMSAAPEPGFVDHSLRYTLVVTNNGMFGASGVKVVDQLTGNAKISNVVASQGSCATKSIQVSCDVGILDTSESATILIDVIPDTTGDITNTATVNATEPDPDTANNTATLQTSIILGTDLSLKLVSSQGRVTVGDNIQYDITITNDGPEPATDVSMIDSLPSGKVNLVSVTTTQGSCIPGSSTIECTLNNLPAGQDATITIIVTALADGDIPNSARVTANELDPDLANNTASVITSVIAVADLGVAVTVVPITARVGQDVFYTFLISNHGPSPAANVILTDRGRYFVSMPSNCHLSGDTVTCNINLLGPGTTVQLNIVARPDAVGIIPNIASVSSDTRDTDLSNNTVTTITRVVP